MCLIRFGGVLMCIVLCYALYRFDVFVVVVVFVVSGVFDCTVLCVGMCLLKCLDVYVCVCVLWFLCVMCSICYCCCCCCCCC